MSELTDRCQDPNGCPSPEGCDKLNTCLIHEMIVARPDKAKYQTPEFIDFLDKSKEIHIRKSNDYAQEGNPFSNFERSGHIASWFNDPVDKAFVILIGVKLARLAELRNGKEPKNESIFDTFLDLGTYCFLWGSYVVRSSKNKILVCPDCNHQALFHNYLNSNKCAFCECKRIFTLEDYKS